MNDKTIILGCGITGLIATHLLEDSLCIEASSEICKDFKDETFPKYLKCCPEINSVCEPTDEANPFDIGVFDGGEIINFFTMPSVEKEKIYKNYCIKKYGCVKPGKMNGYMETTSQEWYY